MKELSKYRLIQAAIWGIIAGFITIAACFAALGGFSSLAAWQIGWISSAGVASTVFTTYSSLAAAKSAAKIDLVGTTLSRMDERAKNHVVALLAKVFSMTSSALASAADDPERFDLAMDNSLAALQIAISRCHELDESLVRVSLISVNRAAGWPQYNGALPDSELSVRSVPGDRMPRFDFRDQDVYEQFEAVMARRHPYRRGWVWDGDDAHPGRGEYHVLSPTERDFTSYIRVGIPGIGVLCVDCSDSGSRLAVADRELALAFADILTFHGKANHASADMLTTRPELKSLEEAR